MLRLHRCILTRLLPYASASASASAISPLHRLLSAAAASPNPSFAVEDYLVSTCGLTRPQALKASARISHLKSPANPDAVLAFLAGLGLSAADLAATVARDPQLLCAKVEETLAPVVDGLTGLGISRSEIARLAILQGAHLRCKPVISKLQYYLPLFGTFDKFLRALTFNSSLLSYGFERVVKPNVAFLRHECLLSDCDIGKLCIWAPRLLTTNPERVQAIAVYSEGLGVPRDSGMFKAVVHAISALDDKKIASRVEVLKRTFRWSDAEVRIAVPKAPALLTKSKDMLQRRSEFLISEVGLEPAYIAHRPVMISYSLEGRLRPRYYVLKFLKENGLLKRVPSYSTIFVLTEKAFMEKFICPHKEATSHLAQDYAAACRGEVPSNFRFTCTKNGL